MILIYVAGISNGIYGLMNMMGGIVQLREKKIETWSAWLMIVFGILLVVSGAGVILQNPGAIILLIIGLIAIHVLTWRNGKYMHGKINLRHHVLRLGISIILIVLTVWSYR